MKTNDEILKRLEKGCGKSQIGDFSGRLIRCGQTYIGEMGLNGKWLCKECKTRIKQHQETRAEYKKDFNCSHCGCMLERKGVLINPYETVCEDCIKELDEQKAEELTKFEELLLSEDYPYLISLKDRIRFIEWKNKILQKLREDFK